MQINDIVNMHLCYLITGNVETDCILWLRPFYASCINSVNSNLTKMCLCWRNPGKKWQSDIYTPKVNCVFGNKKWGVKWSHKWQVINSEILLSVIFLIYACKSKAEFDIRSGVIGILLCTCSYPLVSKHDSDFWECKESCVW